MLCRCGKMKCASARARHRCEALHGSHHPGSSMSIPSTRIRILNDAEPRSGARYVLYWMQQSQRARFNPALEYAVDEANARDLPVLVCFGLTDGYPEANARHYTFMLEGLAEVARALAERGITLMIGRGSPDQVALGLAEDAALIVCDRGYLK